MEFIFHADIAREDELDTTTDICHSTWDIPLFVPDTPPTHIYEKIFIFSILESVEVLCPILSGPDTRYRIILHKYEFYILG